MTASPAHSNPDDTLRQPVNAQATQRHDATSAGQSTCRPRPTRVGTEAPAEYTLLETIAAGSYGTIHRLCHLPTARMVAGKVLTTNDPEQRQHFLAEATLTARLNHPNIVPVHDLITDQDGREILILRLVDGQGWDHSIRELSLEDNLRILLSVCDAMSYAHDQGIIHRDIKPANVMLGSYGEVQVMDWGVAIPLDQADNDRSITGTPAYMAPEMARGTDLSIASDIYLLGAVLFEILTGLPPHPARDCERCLKQAAANHIRAVKQRGELMDIARQAMAEKPSDRPTSVTAFRDRLGIFEEHAHSMMVSNRALQTLDRAIAAGDYRLFNNARFGCEEALELWPRNQEARQGLSRIRLAHANLALRRDDLDLAASLLHSHDPTHAALREQLLERQRQQVDRRRATRRLVRVEERQRRRDDLRWRTVFDLTHDDLDAAWQPIGGRIAEADGSWRFAATQPGLLLLRQAVLGDVRLRWTCRCLSPQPCDVSCFLAATESSDPVNTFRSGYEVKYGAFNNTCNRIYRQGTVLFDEPDIPLHQNRRLTVEVSRIGSRLRLAVDGKDIAEVDDANPLFGTNHARVGLFGWNGIYQIEALTVETLPCQQRINLIELGQRHLHYGRTETARDILADAVRVAHDDNARRQAEQSLAAVDRLLLWQRQLPEFQRRIREAWPQAHIELHPQGLVVDVSFGQIKDLSPLSKLPIYDLRCHNNHISDLSPLAGCPLIHLRAGNNHIADLGPLAGHELRSLTLKHNRLTGLEALADCPLEELDVSRNAITDLSPLRDLPLRELDLSRNDGLCDLEAIGQEELRDLNISHTAVVDLAPLRRCQLHTLCINNCRISDLGPLAGMPLHYLFAAYNSISNLAPLRGMDLKQLHIDHNQIQDLSPLEDMPLLVLHIDNNRITDLWPIEAFPPRQILSCFDNPIPTGQLRSCLEQWTQDSQPTNVCRSIALALGLREEDADLLRSLAITSDGRQWLRTQHEVPIHRLRQIARHLQATAPCLPTAADQERFLSLLPNPDHPILLGLRPGADHWDDGSPVTWTNYRRRCEP